MPSWGQSGSYHKNRWSRASRSRWNFLRRQCCRWCRRGLAGQGRDRIRERRRRPHHFPVRRCSRRSRNWNRQPDTTQQIIRGRAGKTDSCCRKHTSGGSRSHPCPGRRHRSPRPSRHGRLEVIDIAIGLIEVAIAIIVVAIPDIELAQISVDVSGCLSGRDLGVIPGIGEIPDEEPGPLHRRYHRNSFCHSLRIVGYLDPIGHIAVDRVAIGRLLDIVIAHRNRPRRVREEQIFEVRLAKVGRPDRRVIDCPVGLWI